MTTLTNAQEVVRKITNLAYDLYGYDTVVNGRCLNVNKVREVVALWRRMGLPIMVKLTYRGNAVIPDKFTFELDDVFNEEAAEAAKAIIFAMQSEVDIKHLKQRMRSNPNVAIIPLRGVIRELCADNFFRAKMEFERLTESVAEVEFFDWDNAYQTAIANHPKTAERFDWTSPKAMKDSFAPKGQIAEFLDKQKAW